LSLLNMTIVLSSCLDSGALSIWRLTNGGQRAKLLAHDVLVAGWGSLARSFLLFFTWHQLIDRRDFTREGRLARVCPDVGCRKEFGVNIRSLWRSAGEGMHCLVCR
jgi:hypothetical protein